MAQKTDIEWTDNTWNPVRGCSRVSEGCRNCYAEIMAARFSGPGQWGEGLAEIVRKPDGAIDHRWTGKLVAAPEHVLLAPLKWKKPRLVFVNSTSDLFHENVPDELIDRVFAVMALTPHITYQVLTKRPERMLKYLYGDDARQRIAWGESAKVMGLHAPQWREETIHGENRSRVIAAGIDWPLPNVWLGVSIEDQATADTRVRYLIDTPAAIRFVSVEPLLASVDLSPWLVFLNWVICGGESGPDARPMHPDWARQLRDQCAELEVPFFFKQWGAWGPPENAQVFTGTRHCAWWWANDWSYDCVDMSDPEANWMDPPDLYKVGKKKTGRMLDGVLHDGFPKVREAV